MSQVAAQAEYSPQQIEALMGDLRAQSPEIQSGILQYVTGNGITDPQQIAGIIHHTLTGNDALAATPTGQGLSNELGELQLAQQTGRTTHTEADIENMKAAVEARVKELIAAGRSDEEIKQAVGQLPGVTPELAAVATQMAQQQLDTEKFNLFNARNQEPQQQEASAGNPFAALLAGNVVQEFSAALNNFTADPNQQRQPERDNSRGFGIG